jgi:hypothetical protein
LTGIDLKLCTSFLPFIDDAHRFHLQMIRCHSLISAKLVDGTTVVSDQFTGGIKVFGSDEWRLDEWRLDEWRLDEWRLDVWRSDEWRSDEWRSDEWRSDEWRSDEW